MPISSKCYGVIPARFASTRFPGKPLADICGKPMIWHVYNRARQCLELDQVLVATDDHRIESVAKELSIPVIMTRKDHISGTDRVLEAALKLGIPEDSIVVNIQGDEPVLHPEMIPMLVKPFSNAFISVSTLAHPITREAAQNPDVVKVVLDKYSNALYFSRAPIPYFRNNQEQNFYGHIGLYAFRLSALKQFVSLAPGHLEIIEKLEQLRLLENRIQIHVVITSHTTVGVDKPEDIEKVVKLLGKNALPEN